MLTGRLYSCLVKICIQYIDLHEDTDMLNCIKSIKKDIKYVKNA